MNTVISTLLLFTYNTLNQDIYYSIAIYILDHLDEIETISINELSQNCHTSVPTINKFCHLMGIETFKKMKNILSSTRKGRLEQIEFRYMQFDAENILNQIELLYQKKINKTELLEQIKKIVDLIYESRSVYFVGAVYPLSLLLNFVEDMRIFNKAIYLEQISYKDNKKDYEENSLLIFITVTGRFLAMNKQTFLDLYEDVSSKKAIISQNEIFSTFLKFNVFIKLYGDDDSEIENLIIIEIFNLIKYEYFMKYVYNK